jgi:steroid delta-isomerase-like uncharacterized protein
MARTARRAALDLVARYYAAFNRGDAAAMLACLADDVVHDVNEGGRREGKKQFSDFLAHMARCYAEQLEDLVVTAADDGTRAAAEFVVVGVYQATDDGLPEAKGQAYRLPAGAFLQITDGKIARVTTYYNLQNWLAQVTRG